MARSWWGGSKQSVGKYRSEPQNAPPIVPDVQPPVLDVTQVGTLRRKGLLTERLRALAMLVRSCTANCSRRGN